MQDLPTLMQLGEEPLVPLPVLRTVVCGAGAGLAACPTLGLLVVASDFMRSCSLSVFRLPDLLDHDVINHGPGLELVYSLGGAGSPPP
jgi:hypothetical protein